MIPVSARSLRYGNPERGFAPGSRASTSRVRDVSRSRGHGSCCREGPNGRAAGSEPILSTGASKLLTMRTTSGVLLALLLGGLHPLLAPPVHAQRPAARDIVWPLPPDTPRVRYVGFVKNERDIGKGPSFFGRLKSWLIGASDPVVAVAVPHDVHVDGRGRILVTNARDPGFWVFDPGAKEARFVVPEGNGVIGRPMGLTTDGLDHVYVADAGYRRVVELDIDGNFVQAYGGEDALLNPVDVAVAPSNDRVYVVDSFLHQVVVFAPDGAVIRRIGKDEGDLVARNAMLREAVPGDPEIEALSSDMVENRGNEPGHFRFPAFAAVGPTGVLYVTDQINGRIQSFSPEGEFLSAFGTLGDGPGAFARPKGLGVDSEGHLYVVDNAFSNVQIFDAEGRLLLAFGGMGVQNGRLWLPSGMAVDSEDRIFVADRFNDRIQIYQRLSRDDGGRSARGDTGSGTDP